MHLRDRGAEVLDRFRAEQRSERTGGGERVAAQMSVQKSGGPGIARSRGVDDAGGFDGFDAVQLAAAGDPGAVLAHFHGGDAAIGGELTGVRIVAGLLLKERTDLVFVGEENVHALFQLIENPVAGDADDLEGGEVDAERATGGAGGVDDLLGQRGVEHQVAFDVGVAHTAKISQRNLIRTQRHGGTEVGAHGALSIRSDKGEAASVGESGAFETRTIASHGGEIGVIALSSLVGADFAEKGCFEAKAGGTERGVGGGTAGRDRDIRADFGHEPGDVGVVHEHHAALGSGDVVDEKLVSDVREHIHDGAADADEIKSGLGHGRELQADGQVRGQNGFIIHFNHDMVVAWLVELEIAEFVDEIDAVKRALGIELALEELGGVQLLNLTTRYGDLDLSFTPSGTGGYDDLLTGHVEYDLDGRIVPVASLADVIRSKQAAGRAKDLLKLADNNAIITNLGDVDADYAVAVSDALKGVFNGIVVLAATGGGSVALIASVSKDHQAKVQEGAMGKVVPASNESEVRQLVSSNAD